MNPEELKFSFKKNFVYENLNSDVTIQECQNVQIKHEFRQREKQGVQLSYQQLYFLTWNLPGTMKSKITE